MKPSWDDAPEWASYLTRSGNGDWYWFEYLPIQDGLEWYAQKGSLYSTAYSSPIYATEIEDRP